jgi:hypothetical protein
MGRQQVNVIFATQGEYANFYLDLLGPLGEKISLDKIGFYVTHASNYAKYVQKARKTGLKIEFVKEWEITDIKGQTPDHDLLQSLEKDFGDIFLWNALLADRRIYNGVLTKAKQDYAPRFSHTQMLCILQNAFTSILRFFDEIKPDVVVGGFTPVTFGEYVFYLIAKPRGIKYLNLNPTKILNYVTFSEEIYREFPHVIRDYKQYLQSDCRDTFCEDSEDYIKNKSRKYEGIVLSTPDFPWKNWLFSVVKWPFVVAKYYLSKKHLDNQTRGAHFDYFNKQIFNPIKEKAIRKMLPYTSVDELANSQYAYYPLHVEPEIALSLFGREYLNQIELVRNIARSLPVTWKLVVKDHPAGVGRRNVKYYRKLLEIPNVFLADHYLESKTIIENAKMVFTVSGFSGFEAVLKGKPVITFGKVFYNMLPDTMVRNVLCLQKLSDVINDFLASYEYSPKEAVSLVAAIMRNSVRLDLYTQVLSKKGRIGANAQVVEEQKNDFVRLLSKQLQIS